MLHRSSSTQTRTNVCIIYFIKLGKKRRQHLNTHSKLNSVQTVKLCSIKSNRDQHSVTALPISCLRSFLEIKVYCLAVKQESLSPSLHVQKQTRGRHEGNSHWLTYMRVLTRHQNQEQRSSEYNTHTHTYTQTVASFSAQDTKMDRDW